MFFSIIQYVSIISDVTFNKVYSYLLVLLMHFRCVVVTTFGRNNVFFGGGGGRIHVLLQNVSQRKLRVRITTIRHAKANPRTRLSHNSEACCTVNWQQHGLYFFIQTADPVYGESKHRNQHNKKETLKKKYARCA